MPIIKSYVKALTKNLKEEKVAPVKEQQVTPIAVAVSPAQIKNLTAANTSTVVNVTQTINNVQKKLQEDGQKANILSQVAESIKKTTPNIQDAIKSAIQTIEQKNTQISTPPVQRALPVNFALGDISGIGGGAFGPNNAGALGSGIGGAGGSGTGGIGGLTGAGGLGGLNPNLGNLNTGVGGSSGGFFPDRLKIPPVRPLPPIRSPPNFYSVNTVALPNFTINNKEKNKQRPEIDDGMVPDFYEATFKYNKYLEGYENLISSASVDERNLLNFQSFLNYKNFEDNKPLEEINEKLKKHIFIRQNQPISTRAFDRILYNDKYFLDFTNKFIPNNRINNQQVIAFMENISISNEMLKDANSADAFKNIFPFYNNVKITYTKKSEFIKNLKKFNLDDEFLLYITKVISQSYVKGKATETNFISKTFDPVLKRTNNYNIKLRFDSNFFINDFLVDRQPLKTEDTNNILLLKGNYLRKTTGKFNNSFFYFATSQALRNKSGLNEGDILAFRVEKTKLDNPSIKQQFIFLNDDETQVFDIVDTQIKYNTKYKYDIYAYRYDRNYLPDNLNPTLQTNGFISEVKMNISDIILSVLDTPPLAPTFTAFLDRTDNKTILFKIDNVCGSNFESPIILDPDKDPKKIQDIRAAFKLQPDSNLLFKNDDEPRTFEIYKLDKPPTRYEQFVGNKLTTVRNTTAFKDTITPNKKYYYCIRSLDVHNFFSNPSFIMQIEIINNSGVSYLESKVYDLEAAQDISSELKLQGKTATISFKKYLQMGPAFLHTLLRNLDIDEFKKAPNPAAESDIDREIFGEAVVAPGLSVDRQPAVSKSPYGRNYKIRIKSKKSGKMVDINFKFVIEKKILS
jgi:hypothetical protein